MTPVEALLRLKAQGEFVTRGANSIWMLNLSPVWLAQETNPFIQQFPPYSMQFYIFWFFPTPSLQTLTL